MFHMALLPGCLLPCTCHGAFLQFYQVHASFSIISELLHSVILVPIFLSQFPFHIPSVIQRSFMNKKPGSSQLFQPRIPAVG